MEMTGKEIIHLDDGMKDVHFHFSEIINDDNRSDVNGIIIIWLEFNFSDFKVSGAVVGRSSVRVTIEPKSTLELMKESSVIVRDFSL